MYESGFRVSSTFRVALGVVAATAAGLLVAIAYLLLMSKVMGARRGMDGGALAASLLLFPIASAVVSVMVWLPLKAWRRTKNRPLTALLALGAGALFGLLTGLVFSGMEGFKLHGGAPAFNYAFTLLGGFGTLALHAVAYKAPGRS